MFEATSEIQRLVVARAIQAHARESRGEGPSDLADAEHHVQFACHGVIPKPVARRAVTGAMSATARPAARTSGG
jgi:hypothetical protein